ncbi:Amino-acid acetyltransferase, mitochondrial [Metarhizium acridum]|uniref:Amino-acid acetyltransferase, mitochondrial n=1 Tax=Metarhizium acridum TaxID=92637 RepID=UPI001C6C1AA9|nr:Amino-acid acetyltransferase, mitochondrial [Metarhizium acridum]KAG8419233.1 Amino-acid acetyltransferase, mitochondrial [Metarhizium acridum]
MTWGCLGNSISTSSRGVPTVLKMYSFNQLRVWQHQRCRCGAATLLSMMPSTTYRCRQSDSIRQLSSPSASRAKKQTLDRDVIVSVLEASATRRDAKGYLQKYASKQPISSELYRASAKDSEAVTAKGDGLEPVNVAIVKLRLPQELSSAALYGIARTLSQLRVLGLLALVVVDCGIAADRKTFDDEALRLCEAIDSFGSPGAKLADHVFLRRQTNDNPSVVTKFCCGMRVEDLGLLNRALQRGMIVVVPSLSRQDEISSPTPAEANETTIALAKFLTGLQLDGMNGESIDEATEYLRPKRIASVERIILLDPVGGTPMALRPDVSHRFINLEQEYGDLIGSLKTGERTTRIANVQSHIANLSLAKDALSLLPPTSSALITSPHAAANTRAGITLKLPIRALGHPPFGFDNMVTTRNQKNPLLHNLLTDRPAFSPSLPLQRIQDETRRYLQNTESGSATLVKRGMPVTVYPDPKVHQWQPPNPGLPRLRLTDNCIDLPRLFHLIEDSFNRKLDAQHYLKRVNENLAGIIIAGEYEGCAILTWEYPETLDEQTAYDSGRFVPYLDKFAVLKNRQGSSGVADIVFNSMVQDCFPSGVCWRSRKNNPVNKWYFERSTGTCKLSDSHWTMFWTTIGLGNRHPALQDYESVCRGVRPSWAENTHSPD